IYFDLHYTGDWSGVGDNSWGNAKLPSPWWGIIGNIFCLSAQNFKPPVFPVVNAWNTAMQHFLQTPFGAHFKGFESFGRLSFGVAETSAALGLGLSVLALISIAAKWHCRRQTSPERRDVIVSIVRWLPWLLLLAFMAKVGTFENGRQLAPYYIFLFPSLLAGPSQSALVRRRWWRSLSLVIMAATIPLLIISRDRPLFPAQTILNALKTRHPGSNFISHVSLTYAEQPAFEAERAFVRNHLPPDTKVLGYAATGREEESLLWLPYGTRRVEVVLPADTLGDLQQMGMHYVVVKDEFLRQTGILLDQWITRYNGTLVKQWEFLENPYDAPARYYLVQLPDRS
ncbi:MAG TPA: hypothetical protein VN625_11215, partial [Desulfuromonadaceae bacterium]|nr:hypothetical protein [Desulfuromonadaceae bacterium]